MVKFNTGPFWQIKLFHTHIGHAVFPIGTNTSMQLHFLNRFYNAKVLFMRTIVFATQKGGSGKSILAACLAVAAQAAGERVFVFDLDPKKSLVRWESQNEMTDLCRFARFRPTGSRQSLSM